MDTNQAFAYFFLYRCLGEKEGSKLKLRKLYDRYCAIYNQISETASDLSLDGHKLTAPQFYKITRIIVNEIDSVSNASFSIQIVRSSKGLVLKNIYLNEFNLLKESTPELEIYKQSLLELNLVDYASKFFISSENALKLDLRVFL